MISRNILRSRESIRSLILELSAELNHSNGKLEYKFRSLAN